MKQCYKIARTKLFPGVVFQATQNSFLLTLCPYTTMSFKTVGFFTCLVYIGQAFRLVYRTLCKWLTQINEWINTEINGQIYIFIRNKHNFFLFESLTCIKSADS